MIQKKRFYANQGEIELKKQPNIHTYTNNLVSMLHNSSEGFLTFWRLHVH